jgi:hypothetical protein
MQGQAADANDARLSLDAQARLPVGLQSGFRELPKLPDPATATHDDIEAILKILGITKSLKAHYCEDTGEMQSYIELRRGERNVIWTFDEKDPWNQHGGPPWLYLENIYLLLHVEQPK